MDQTDTSDWSNFTQDGSIMTNNNDQYIKQVNSYGQLYFQPTVQHGHQVEFSQNIPSTCNESEDYNIRQVINDAGSRASSPGELLLCESTLDGSSSDSNPGDESRGSFRLNDTAEMSGESGYHRPEKGERHYQRNEVAVNPKYASMCGGVFNEGSLLVGSDQSTVMVQPGSPESPFASSENQWSRPSSANSSSLAGSVLNEATSPVSFPSADEIMQQRSRSYTPTVGRVAPALVEVGPESLHSDFEDACESDSDISDDGSHVESANSDSKLPPISYIAPMSRTPSPDVAADDTVSSNKMGIVQNGLSGLLGGIPKFTIPDSLKLLDNHIQSLHQRLVQHAVKMSLTTDAESNYVMAQEQRHMLEAQRLLMHNQQLMVAQLYGSPVNAQMMKNLMSSLKSRDQDPSTDEPSTQNYHSSKQAAYPNLMQQLSTPPLSRVQPVLKTVDPTIAPQPEVMHSLPQMPVEQTAALVKPSVSPQSCVKREIASPVSPEVFAQTANVSPPPTNPALIVKREMITPPPNSRGPSPVPSNTSTSPVEYAKTSSLRDILTRPPKVMPPDVRIGAGQRPVQTVPPFYQRPMAIVAASPHVRSPPVEVKEERRGVPMTRIRITPSSVGGQNQSNVVLPPNLKEEKIAEQLLKQSAAAFNPNVKSSLFDESNNILQPAMINKVPWTQPSERPHDMDDEDYAVRYVTTPVKRRRRRPLGQGKKPYCKTCNICKESFYKSEEYKDHMNKAHASSFKYWCEECHRGYNDPRCIVEHKLKHENKDFPCTFCSKRFKSLSGFKRHQSEHTGNYLYRCMHCGEGYNIRKQFEAHQNRHVGHGYRCFRCNKMYYHKALLTSHMSRCLNRLSTESASPPPEAPSPSGSARDDAHAWSGRQHVDQLDNPMNRLNMPPLSPGSMENSNSSVNSSQNISLSPASFHQELC